MSAALAGSRSICIALHLGSGKGEDGLENSQCRVELLLPTRDDLVGALRVIDEFKHQSYRDGCSIIVSVSDPNSWLKFEQALNGLSGVKLLPPDGDLTLYGNFRRLVLASTAEWISICADDDSIPRNFTSLVAHPLPEKTCLVLPPIELRPYDRATAKFGDLLDRLEPISAGKRRIEVAREIQPTWVFGLWRGDWLRSAFPPNDFDWLDCALLHKAIMSNAVSWVSEADPLVCGYNPNRRPWAVDPAGHSTLEWKIYCQQFIRSASLTTRLLWRLRVERFFDSIAEQLNRK